MSNVLTEIDYTSFHSKILFYQYAHDIILFNISFDVEFVKKKTNINPISKV